MSSDTKIPLPAFLKVLTNSNLAMPKAINLASKVYKTHNTPAKLGKLTDAQLKTLGVESKEDRKIALAAFKKAGYRTASLGTAAVGGALVSSSSAGAGPSSSGKARTKPASKKRKRDDDLNEFLPTGPRDEGAALGSFEFNEVTDVEAVVNRAPVMTAWATVREEALSITSAYTEMNAITKGVSLGIFEQGKGKGIEHVKGDSQPYIDLMGRRPGEPVEPASAFAYMSRAFRQTLPFIMGAMRLLADTFSPTELNEKGFGLYAEFRPEVNGCVCATILSLRKVREGKEVTGNGPGRVEEGREDPKTRTAGRGAVPQESEEHVPGGLRSSSRRYSSVR
ncbi:hypothetical protein DFH11DRAFT_1601049 [Phellopilus nigrolimitatus]|nr:hypothetical protein DFH11DRAFT_1601049 [Phellopilus nigrolimitatus]